MGKFSAVTELRHGQSKEQGAEETSPVATPAPAAAKSVATKGPGRPAGKRSNPDFESTTVFLRKTTKKSANRMLEDREIDLDLSDLLEVLLMDWLVKQAKHS
jgi:hypothetical protein